MGPGLASAGVSGDKRVLGLAAGTPMRRTRPLLAGSVVGALCDSGAQHRTRGVPAQRSHDGSYPAVWTFRVARSCWGLPASARPERSSPAARFGTPAVALRAFGLLSVPVREPALLETAAPFRPSAVCTFAWWPVGVALACKTLRGRRQAGRRDLGAELDSTVAPRPDGEAEIWGWCGPTAGTAPLPRGPHV